MGEATVARGPGHHETSGEWLATRSLQERNKVHKRKGPFRAVLEVTEVTSSFCCWAGSPRKGRISPTVTQHVSRDQTPDLSRPRVLPTQDLWQAGSQPRKMAMSSPRNL